MTSGEPVWADPPPPKAPRPPAPYPVGCEPIRTYLIEHVRLGQVRVSVRDYVPEMGPILEALEADGTPLR